MDMEQIKMHNSKDDCWIVIHGKVYNITNYLDDHPGGSEIILSSAGSDASHLFDDIGHSQAAVTLLDKYEIGVCDSPIIAKEPSFFQRLFAWVFPSIPKEKIVIILTNRVQLTHDTVKLTFEIPHNVSFGLQTGQHIVCYCGEYHRKYTPVSYTDGELELIVKVYPDGRLSSYIGNLAVGDELLVSGPVGDNIYLGNGEFSCANKSIVTNNILFICAGTGITPIYAIMNQIANTDTTNIYTKLLVVNRTEDDIICRDELDQIHTLTQPDDDWNGLVGRPSKEMIAGIASEKRDETVIICGSRAFNDNITAICLDLGYDKERMIVY